MAWFNKQSNQTSASKEGGSAQNASGAGQPAAGQAASGQAAADGTINAGVPGQTVQPGAVTTPPAAPPTQPTILNPASAEWWQQAEQTTPQSKVTVSETVVPPPNPIGAGPNPPTSGPAYLGPPVHQNPGPGPADHEPTDPPLWDGQTPVAGASIQGHGGSALQKAQNYLDHSTPLPGPLERQNSDGKAAAGSLTVGLTDPTAKSQGTWAGLRPDELNPLGGFNPADAGKGKD